MNPACTDCPIRQQKRGCGWLPGPCQHPEHRDEYRKYQQKENSHESKRTSGDDVVL